MNDKLITVTVVALFYKKEIVFVLCYQSGYIMLIIIKATYLLCILTICAMTLGKRRLKC